MMAPPLFEAYLHFRHIGSPSRLEVTRLWTRTDQCFPGDLKEHLGEGPPPRWGCNAAL